MDKKSKTHLNNNEIYLSIDHLKQGDYKLNILDNNKVVKAVKISKRQ